MAERIVSPGVFTRENDLSFLPQGVGEIGAAFIGPLKEGPSFVPTIVRTAAEFEEKFGKVDGTYYTEYAVQNYLREAGQATIVRVGGIGGYTQTNGIAIVASGSINGRKIVGTLYSTSNGDAAVGFVGPTLVSSLTTSGSFTISGITGSGTNGNVSASILPSATNDIADVFGESATGAKKAYSYLFFENIAATYTGSVYNATVVEAISLPTQVYGNAAQAETPIVESQLISGERYNLFKFVTIGDGTAYNTKFKVAISNVKAAGEDGATDYSTFTVTIRRFDDTDKRKVVLETFANVNLDPSSTNYIGRRIGDRYYTTDDSGKITEFGDWGNQSKYIRVVTQDANSNIAGPGSYPISAAPFGHEAYVNPIKTNNTNEASYVPPVVYSTAASGNTASSPVYYSGFDFETSGVSDDNKMYLKPIPAGVTAGANTAFAFDSQLSYVMTGSNSTDMAKRQFILGFQYGFDGNAPTVKINLGADMTQQNSQGLNLASSVSNGTLGYFKAINAISNADEYDINMVVTPGIIRELHPAVTTKVIDMVEDRQDCFYIADFNESDATIAEATAQSNSVDSNYVATYYPWVKTLDTNTNKILSVPPSVLMPAVFAANDRLAAEWFAPAGLNRGGITGAISVLNRLTHAERDTLYENKVNPIASFPGQGIVAFGQKTLQDKASALDRINVRRLLIVLKKFIASTSRYLVFEQNTATTRARFLNTVNPYLEAVQQRQGLYAFKVVMDETNNTPDVIDRNILAGQIFLQPAKTAEFIVIDFNILPTGASFSA
jgi:phage tail sheath protein FI